MNYIFDFDGTLADSLNAFITVFNKVIRGDTHPLSSEEIEKFRGMSSRQALRRAGVRWWQIPKLVIRGLHDFRALIPTMHSFEGMTEVLKELHKRGDKLFVISSNTRDNVGQFLSQQDVYNLFTEIDTEASIFNKSKHIRRMINLHDLKRTETFYIGDETRDIQAGKRARVRVVAVTWGFNQRKILKRFKPHYVISKPNELLELK